MFENETQETILKRLLDTVPNDIDKREGSIVWDMLSPISFELYNIYQSLEMVLDSGFAETSSDEFLDLRAAEVGIYRKPANKAEGEITLTGPVNTVIDAGTLVSTGGVYPIYYLTKNAVTIDATLSVKVGVECEIGGEEGNIESNSLSHVVGNLTNIVTVTNELAFSGGSNLESDDELRERYYRRVLKPATSGNENHYYLWATSVSGIGDAKINALKNGPGTVEVLLLGSDKKPANASLVTEVATLIEKERPVGATVTVLAANSFPIDVNATLVLESGVSLSDIEVKVGEALDRYLESLAFKDSVVRYSKILSLILSTEGVIDCTELTVSGGSGNITLDSDTVAVSGGVMFLV